MKSGQALLYSLFSIAAIALPWVLAIVGSIKNDGQKVEAGQMLIRKTDDHECEICIKKDSQILLFSEKPLQKYVFFYGISCHTVNKIG